MTAPAARIRATTGLSVPGIRSTPPVPLYSSDQPAVVGKPTMSIGSFTITGTPASGPSASPSARRRSIVRASARASGLRKMMALWRGLNSAMRSRNAWVSASDVMAPLAKAACACSTVSSTGSIAASLILGNSDWG